MKRIILLITLFFCVQYAFAQVFYFAKSSYGTNGIANTYVGNSMAVLEGGKS